MKKTIVLAAILATAITAHADPSGSEFPRWSVSVDTNATSVTTNTPYADEVYNGWADTLIVELAGTASPTCTVSFITASGSDIGASRTILTVANTTGGVYPVRDVAVTQAGSDISTNAIARIPLFSRLRMLAYAANTTNVTAKAWLVPSPRP
jgi:hypothetical protein